MFSIRSNTSLSIALVGALFAGAAQAASNTNKGANPNGKPFIELNGEIVEIEGEVSTLQDQVDSLVGRVDTLEGKVAANMTAIDDLEAISADLQAQIDANADDIASLQGEVAALEGENAALQGEIDELGDADGSLRAQIDANNALITTLNQSLSNLSVTLQDQIDNNADLIALLQDEIDRIDAELAEKQNLINGICPDGSAVVEVLATGDIVCNLVSGGGSGELEAILVYGEDVTPSTGGFANVTARCPAGWIVSGVGWHGHNARIDDLYFSGTYGYVGGFSSYHLQSTVSCFRIAP